MSRPSSKPSFRRLPLGCSRSGAATVISPGPLRVSVMRLLRSIRGRQAARSSRPVSLEEFTGTGPFDAVLANRALHHIPDLAGALERVARLLRPGGRLIVHEHAWERMDEPTARWYLEHRATIDPAAARSGAGPALHGALLRLDPVSPRRAGGRRSRAGGARSSRGREDPGDGLRLCRRDLSARLRHAARFRGCVGSAARSAGPRSRSVRSPRCRTRPA